MHHASCITLQSGIPGLQILGKEFAKHMLKQIPNYSFKLRALKKPTSDVKTDIEIYFAFSQALINFMASCPDDAERSDAYHILNSYISKFFDDGRFAILANTLKTCPYPTLLGLVLHRLKEEIRMEYDSFLSKINRQLNPTAPYKPLLPPHLQEHSNSDTTTTSVPIVTPAHPPLVTMDAETLRQLRIMAKNSHLLTNRSIELLLEVLPKYVDEPDMDTADVLLHGLNLYYFLLLRDSQANVTQIMQKEMQSKFKDSILDPLTVAISKMMQHVDKAQVKAAQQPTITEKLKQELATKVVQPSSEEEQANDDQVDEEIDKFIENMTEEELDKFLKEEEDESDDDDEQTMQVMNELKKHTPVQRNILQLRLVMLQEVLHRIASCLSVLG